MAEGRAGDASARLEAVLARPTEDVYRDLALVPLLAVAEVALGRADEAERRTAEAMARAEEYGDRLHLIDLLRVRGLALDALDRQDEGRDSAERSLALAREVAVSHIEG